MPRTPLFRWGRYRFDPTRLQHLLPAPHPLLAVFSGLGWAVLGASIAFSTAGALLGWAELMAASLAGLLFLLIGAVFIIGRTSYGVDMNLAHTRVTVGDTAFGSITVTNSSSRPMLPASLEFPVGGGTAVFHLPRMKPQDQHEDLFTIPTSARTVIVVGPVRSVRADPMRLLSRNMKLTESVDLYVHPRTVALLGSAAGFIRDLEGLPTTNLSNADISFHALREYVPGDDRRHIHWKTTARTGTLMVRQFEETRRAHLAMALSTNLDEYESEADLELAISAAASIGKQAISEQRELSILTQAGPLRTETGRILLDGMTRLTGSRTRTTAIDVVRLTSDAVPNASVIFFVVGSAVTPSQLRSAAAAVPPGVRSFAVRCQTGAALDRRSIGDLTVLTLGELSELPLLLKRAAA